MAARNPTSMARQGKHGGKRVRGQERVHPDGAQARARDAEAATNVAWSAVKEAVRSGKAQPATAARATGRAVSKFAKSGARQTGVAAEAIARAAEELLMSAMSEARAAAKAAREAAKEVEKSVGAALKAVRIAVRKRALVAVNRATRERGAARKTGKRAR